MKMDMHCHVKEGSLDSRVGIGDYIERLIQKGFQGMLVTDHDTYNGYRYWKEHIKGQRYQEFLVLKGIEYDTVDGGHFLCIMPEEVKMRVLELRGLTVAQLVDVVHRHGGILGPAHPCGEKYLSYTTTKAFRSNPDMVNRFDFIEVFNACESKESNRKAKRLAEKYQKLGLGGSDAHRLDCIGMGYTQLPKEVRCETEFISLVRGEMEWNCGGSIYGKTTKDKMGRANKILVYSFWFYNKLGALWKRRRRNRKKQIENPVNPIDPIEIPYLKKQQERYLEK